MNNDNPDAFYQQLIDIFDQRGMDTAELSGFAHKLFMLAPIHELSQEPASDICGLIQSLHLFFEHYNGLEPKLRSFNPNLNEDSWEHRHTQLFILQRDSAFIVDSVRMAMDRMGMGVQSVNSTIFDVVRDDEGNLVSWSDTPGEKSHKEALIYFQVDHYLSEQQHDKVLQEVAVVLEAVAAVNKDYKPSINQITDVIGNIREKANQLDSDIVRDNLEFLEWLRDNHFTFLAYSYYHKSNDPDALLSLDGSRSLGLFRHNAKQEEPQRLSELSPGVQEFHADGGVLTLSKSIMRSRVHRDAYCDYVIVKDLAEDGSIRGEHRFLGLYTSLVYSQSPFSVPMINRKLNRVFERSALNPSSHSGKSLRQVIEVHPREELFHGTEDQLYDILIGIWQINERRQVRLFVRTDPFEKFVNCIVYFPRDSYRTEVREKTQKLLMDELVAHECQFYTYFTQSLLVRTHFVIRTVEGHRRELNIPVLEKQIANFASDWRDELHKAIIEHWGDEKGIDLSMMYRDAFPVSYQAHIYPRTAIHDIELFDQLDNEGQVATLFFQPSTAAHGVMRLKIFHPKTELSLSRMVPMLENLGFQVIGEHPYALEPTGRSAIWAHDFTLQFSLDIEIDVSAVRQNFVDALTAVWHGDIDDDRFNWLVIGARLDWRSVALMRVYARYMKQLGITISQDFIATTLTQNLDITRNLVALFKNTFDPKRASADEEGSETDRSQRIEANILEAIGNVSNLNQDQVLRTYLQLIKATLRTNFFQQDANGRSKSYISVKLSPRQLSVVPEPRPEYEIFVYSVLFEGVHLRTGKVARGGIRWSDRVEDYRTEVLGLVKAQQVKNAVIVPAGAKGGFVVKKEGLVADRSKRLDFGKSCYQWFMSAMLDLTDNVINGQIVPPVDVVRRDSDDAYLVVAADKGTASFSDLANGVSLDHQHWLGDAFASGGSHGYDHKKMGITARGAWVAVQRHFREKGINIQEESISVVGIGDMAGDVFGNGMLLSPHIALVAAFNHRAIFLDPHPDVPASFDERKRLFDNTLGWEEYNSGLISTGGGVFSRDLKSISLSSEVQKRFNITQTELTPAQLIKHLLKSSVDLIWNGGIGTYVKAVRESNLDAGDRANDDLRVNGRDLQCKVFGEGGNLGMTQEGRIEFCLHGGACNTDFIDNSAGVDCSDHEVNIKIALDQLVANDDLTVKQRNGLLVEMTQEVATNVLKHNYRQTQAISLSLERSKSNPSEFWQCITDWEAGGELDRKLENLPDDDTLNDRLKRNLFLTRPEFSVLLCYSKILFKQALQETDIHLDKYIAQEVFKAFPTRIVDNYPGNIENHTLMREVLCNQLANEVIDLMGIPYVHRQLKSTGACAADVARAYIIARDVFDLMTVWQEIEGLDYTVSAPTQAAMQLNLMRLGRRSTRWLLRNRRACENARAEIEQLRPILQSLIAAILSVNKSASGDIEVEIPGLEEMGLSEYATVLIDSASDLYFALGMADVSIRTGASVDEVTDAYGQLGEILSLEVFTTQIIFLSSADRWEDFARESFMDELESQFRAIVVLILDHAKTAGQLDATVIGWQQSQKNLIHRWQDMVKEVRNSSDKNFAMVSVALRELNALLESTRMSFLNQ